MSVNSFVKDSGMLSTIQICSKQIYDSLEGSRQWLKYSTSLQEGKNMANVKIKNKINHNFEQ